MRKLEMHASLRCLREWNAKACFRSLILQASSRSTRARKQLFRSLIYLLAYASKAVYYRKCKAFSEVPKTKGF